MIRKLLFLVCFVAVFCEESETAQEKPVSDDSKPAVDDSKPAADDSKKKDKGGYASAPQNDPRNPKKQQAPPLNKPIRKEKALVIIDSGKVKN